METRNKRIKKDESEIDMISINNIIPDILRIIFYYLDPLSLSRIARVSKHFNATISSSQQIFWNTYSQKIGIESYPQNQQKWLALRYLAASVQHLDIATIFTILIDADKQFLASEVRTNQPALNQLYETIKHFHLVDPVKAKESFKYVEFIYFTIKYNQINEMQNILETYSKLDDPYLEFREYPSYMRRKLVQGKMLLYAAKYGRLEILQLLIEKYQFKVNFYNNKCRTSMYYAAKHGHLDIVNCLIAMKAKIDAKSYKTGATPLFVATDYGHLDIVHTLLKHGANIQAVTNLGKTCLHKAVERRHLKMVKLFLEEGADINATNGSGFTPIYLAALRGYCEIVEILLLHGANKNIVVYINKSKLIDQAREYSPEIFARTLAHIENFMTDMISISPVQIASIMGHTKIVKLFSRYANDEYEPVIHKLKM